MEELILKVVVGLNSEYPDLDQLKIRSIIEVALDGFEVKKEERALAVEGNILDFVQMYLISRKIEGLSEETLKDYYRKLLVFSRWVPKNIDKISTLDIRKFLFEYEKERNIKKSSLDNIQTIVKTFFKWLQSEGFLEKSPAEKLKNIKTEKVLKKALTQEEVERLREYGCKKTRERALLELLLSSGARVSEVAQLDIKNINWNDRRVTILGKGNKEREIYFSERAKVHLLKYLDSRKQHKSEALFISHVKPFERISIRTIQTDIKKIGERANLPFSLHPHLLRHTMATLAYSSGVPLPIIQEMLGHSDPSTTQIYAELDRERVRDAHNRFVNI